MGETALNFGPDWIRALANEDKNTSPEPPVPPIQPPTAAAAAIPKYKLAKFRYGREEMLALIPKDPKQPDCLKRDTCKVARDTFSLPLALTPATEEEQRLMSRSWNSDAVIRASSKSGPGGGMGRGGRGGSVDRGRGRGGRGGFYQQRGMTYEDSEDGPPNFSRPKPIERSQSASEKDQRWDDRDRRYDRPYSGRGGGMDDNGSKLEHSRSYHSQEPWRKYDKDGESDWRSAGCRSTEKSGSRSGSWRNTENDSRDIERNASSRTLNGNVRGSSSGNHLPEWSVDEVVEQDVVGTFDSSGAFLETKLSDDSSGEIYVSDDAEEETGKDSPETKKESSKARTPKKNSPPPQVASSASKQNILKQSNNPRKREASTVEKHPPGNAEPLSGANVLTHQAVNKSADHVIKPNNSVQHHNVNSQKLDSKTVVLPNVPEMVEKSPTKTEHVILEQRKTVVMPTCAAIEEEAFAHHKKATENMVAQWTEEEEQKVISQTATPVIETEAKWFYQDPQGEIQGPFKSSEMMEWFNAGYFTMTLMVRRTCDDNFSALGDLIKTCGHVPFITNPPPSRAPPMTTSLPTAQTQTIVPNTAAAVPTTVPVASQLPKQDDTLLALQQQMLQQQFMQQQLMLRQAQLQQLMSQLKQQDNFASLNSQQQQQVVMQQFMAQQQMPRPNLTGVPDQPGMMDALTPLPLQLLSLPMAPLLKNDMSLWNVGPTASPWPLNVAASQPPTTSIWDVDPPKQNSDEAELEKQKQLAEEQERLRMAEEERLAREAEMKEGQKQEELRRRQEEERILIELQKQEEEKKRFEELKRQEEEKRRQEELRRLEEQRQREEELRKQEELRRIEEQKRLEELKRQEEENRRLEELKRKEEAKRQEEARKAEQKRLEQKRKKEELQKMIEMELEQQRIEQEKQKEAERLKEIEREQQIQRERQKQAEEEMRRLAEIKLKSQGPAWGIKTSQSDSQLSLVDIQRLQEEKERQEREEQKERIRQLQLQQQIAAKEVQQVKNSMSWAKRSAEVQPSVKSLAEIQQEEAERLAQQQKVQKPQAPAPVVNSNVGVWGNASHRITAAPTSWNINNVTTTSGFWDDALSSTQQIKKQPAKSNDSAFPALSNHSKPAAPTVNSNKSKNVRAKKEEDAIKKLFGNRKPTDEFTVWCTEALSTMPSSVDVPTFVAFLKDIESPYEVHDYVKSYLGDGKEPREFAKLFLEKRSKFRTKQTAKEDNSLWGPAPAITPVVNKSTPQVVNDNDGNSNSKGKSKRRKNRMQKMDSSMLGFTVQPNPDRVNAGEIDHIEM